MFDKASARSRCVATSINAEQKRRIRRAVRSLKRRGATDVLIMVESTGVGDPIFGELYFRDITDTRQQGGKTILITRLVDDREEGDGTRFDIALVFELAQQHGRVAHVLGFAGVVDEDRRAGRGDQRIEVVAQ